VLDNVNTAQWATQIAVGSIAAWTRSRFKPVSDEKYLPFGPYYWFSLTVRTIDSMSAYLARFEAMQQVP